MRYAALALSLLACGGTVDTDSADTDSPDDTEVSIDCATDPWNLDADMHWKQTWMTMCMVPAIGPLMREIDPVRFEAFSCPNCHGAGASSDYAMPGGTTLSWGGDWDPAFYDATAMSGPMTEVRQTAGDLLGYEAWSTDNPDGFSCDSCHQGL